MPFYTWLSPRTRDSKNRLRNKKRVGNNLLALRQALQTHIAGQPAVDNAAIPADSTRILRLATWNIREFDSNSYGERLDESYSYIAEIISHFDLIAIQEVREDLRALKEVMRLLGSGWSYLVTDVTEGRPGNRERMAFVYNRDKVWFRGVAGELTLPMEQQVTDPYGERIQIRNGPELNLPAGQSLISPTGLKISTKNGIKKLGEDVAIPLPPGSKLSIPSGTAVFFPKDSQLSFNAADGIDLPAGSTLQLPQEAIITLPPDSIVGGPMQFARTPFIASFQAGWLKINLCTVHIYYGKGKTGLKRRNEEIQRLTKILATRAKNDSDSDADSYFIALGDFNIIGKNHETMASLQSNKFKVPEALFSIPGSNVKKDKTYDQIAVWTGQSKRRKAYTKIQVYRAGVFDYFETVFRSDEEAVYRPFMKKKNSNGMYKSYSLWRTHQMSDHLPMWIELHIDFSDDYLKSIVSNIDSSLQG